MCSLQPKMISEESEVLSYMWLLIGLSTSTSTCTGTCGFICGKTCTYRSPVCRYPVLKLPTSMGDDFGIVDLLIGTRTQLGAHLGTRLSRHLKFATRHSAPCRHHIHTSLMFNLPSPPCIACLLFHDITLLLLQ